MRLDSKIILNGVRLSAGVPAPVADFTADAVYGPIPLNVSFTDLSTGSPTSWAWDFTDNGSTDSTLQNPSTTYSTAGTYSVKLTASNAGGADSLTKTAYITATPPALSGNLTTLFLVDGITGTIPYFALDVPAAIHAYGDKSFIWQAWSDFNAAHGLIDYRWNGTQQTAVTLVASNSAIARWTFGMYRDPRGFIILCQGTNGTSIFSNLNSFHLRTIDATAANQTTAISTVQYSGTVKTANTFLPIGSILPDPAVTNGFIGVLTSGTEAAGRHTLVKFIVNNSGIISDITFLGSRTSAPTFSTTFHSNLASVVGLDDKIYINSSTPTSSLGGLWSIGQDGSSYVNHFTSFSGTTIGGGIALDDAGNIYLGSGAGDVILRTTWTGTEYNYAGTSVIAGLLNDENRIDGPLGTNRVTQNTVVANNLGNGTIGIFNIGLGGARGFYRILS